jgi:hypothetical protein
LIHSQLTQGARVDDISTNTSLTEAERIDRLRLIRPDNATRYYGANATSPVLIAFLLDQLWESA